MCVVCDHGDYTWIKYFTLRVCACWCVSSHHSTLHLSLHNLLHTKYVSPSPQYAGLKLCGTLISARGIPAMDANGLMASNRCTVDDTELSFSGKSDPYCVVGIISENEKDSEKVKTGNIMNWVKEDASSANVFRSTTKPATLEPVWNEEFEL